MTRKEMLDYLNQIPFNVFWPGDSWDDLGFTESPIWIDNKGYGYYYCDEPNTYYMAACIPDEKWKQIRLKLAEHKLSFGDLKGTSLEKMYFFEGLGEWYSYEQFSSLLELPELMKDSFYVAEIDDEVRFFSTVEKMGAALKSVHDNYSVKWEELPDEMLLVWVERLTNGKRDKGFDFFVAV